MCFFFFPLYSLSLSSLSPPSILLSTGAVAVSSDAFERQRKLIHMSDVCCTGWEWEIRECASFNHSREDGEMLMMNPDLDVAAVRCVGSCPPPTIPPTFPPKSPTNSTSSPPVSTPDCTWSYSQGEVLVPLNYSEWVLNLFTIWEIEVIISMTHISAPVWECYHKLMLATIMNIHHIHSYMHIVSAS